MPGRVTDDVDVISEGMPQVLADVAERVANRHGLRRDWINDAARLGLPHLAPGLVPIFSGERLTVYRASATYVLATKLNAGRPGRSRGRSAARHCGGHHDPRRDARTGH